MSKRKFVYFWKYVFLILVAIISIFPMYWMIVSGTNKSVDVIVGKILPGNYLMENLKSLLDTTVLSQAMWNSIRNAVVSMVLNVFVCSLAGYGFEKFHDKYKDKIMSIFVTFHDGTDCSNCNSIVPYVWKDGTFKYNRWMYFTDRFYCIYDIHVPPGSKIISG